MLLELHIKNFALIDSLDIEFYNGLNILTGETGAGKSILIDSVSFILGDKQTREIVRVGQSFAFAEAVFDMEGNSQLLELLRQNGILEEEVEDNKATSSEEETLLIISREINKNGRSVSRINGRTVTVSTLKEIGRVLLDIHGQHEHQSLLDETTHIDILDSFCKNDFDSTKAEYQRYYQRLKEIDRVLDESRTDEQSKLRRIDLLRYQINEISEARLQQDEDEELRKRRELLTNSEKIFNTLSASFQHLHENEGCAYDHIGASISLLDHIERYDDRIKMMNDLLKDVYYKLEDVTESIRDIREQTEFDQDELDEIEARLDIISKLKRKYGNSIGEILEYESNIELELEQLERSGANMEKLIQERAVLLEQVIGLAAKITSERRLTAETLRLDIEEELKYLGMVKAIFEISIVALGQLDEKGADKISFNISANPGEPPKPLVKVASGGEMSRIMLAIKNVIADIDRIPTLIFDEIDTGISGRTAQAVAEKMIQISSRHQLLCVTHLPQIAAMADKHFKIEKNINYENERTSTNVKLLDEVEQIEELARMLGGAEVTDLTRQHASEMLRLAGALKKK